MKRIIQEIWELRDNKSQEQEGDNKVEEQKVIKVSEVDIETKTKKNEDSQFNLLPPRRREKRLYKKRLNL